MQRQNGQHLQSGQFADLQTGDIIRFKSADKKIDTCWGYEQVRIIEAGLNKDGNGIISNDHLIPLSSSTDIFPNPFNPTTTFRVSLPEPTNVRLSVFNMLGQHVATVVDGEVQAGYNDFRFNGSSLSSGIYFYRLEMGKEVKSGKLMLLK